MKDPTGTFMRLIWATYQTELEYGRTSSQQSFRKLKALQKQMDRRVKEFFLENPEQAPSNAVHPMNRMGLFVRKVSAWRIADNAYWHSKNRDRLELLYKCRREVDKDLERYFQQFPDERPIELKQPKLTLEEHRRDYQQAIEFFNNNGSGSNIQSSTGTR